MISPISPFGHGLVVVIDDAHVGAEDRPAGREQEVVSVAHRQPMVVGREEREYGRRLGHAIPLRELALEDVHRLAQRLLRDRRRAVDDHPQVLVRALHDVGHHDEHSLDHRRHEQGERDLLLAHHAHDLVRDEVLHDVERAAVVDAVEGGDRAAAWYIGATMR